MGVRGEQYCDKCSPSKLDEILQSTLITTTGNLDGYRILRYLDIESVEVVIGTGLWSEFTGDLADILGLRSGAFESKLKKAKQAAIGKLKFLAFDKGGNAVVGVDLDYTEFSGNRVGVIANGTVVEVSKMDGDSVASHSQTPIQKQLAESELVKKFIERPGLTSEEVITLVGIASRAPELLSAKCSVNGNSLLHYAAMNDLEEEAKQLVALGAKGNSGNGNGKRPYQLTTSRSLADFLLRT